MSSRPVTAAPTPSFDRTLAQHGLTLRRARTEILQLNIGKLCNLTCVHCHVNAGPRRKEIMRRETIDRVLAWLAGTDIATVDLTGGAPEMIPDFRHLIERLRALPHVRRVIDRCNLTILLEPGYEWLPEFLAGHRIEIVASMPCYSPENVNAQRGDGVFDASIRALQLLNRLGYGRRDDLPLHLVYNPNGDFLPGPQADLQADYQRELQDHFGIRFNELFTIANMPIARFASWLKREGRLAEYQSLLVASFNPATVDGLMCRDTLSVDWQGRVFDCDFNQQLDLPLADESSRFLWDVALSSLAGLPIATRAHCFGCTASAGSSCQGAVA